MWTNDFRPPPPTNLTFLERSLKKFVAGDYVSYSYPEPNLVQICSWEGELLGKCVKCNNFFIYTLFGELTYRSDRSADFHAWWLKRCRLVQGCAYFDGSNSHKTPFFFWGGRELAFSSQTCKNSNFHIFETTALIATKFCTVINTARYPLGLCPNKFKMADGRHL